PGAVIDDAASATPTLSVNGPPPCPVVCAATLTVTDPMDLSDTEDTSVKIRETSRPTITVHLTPAQLWPPNHKMVNITATVVAEDLCDPHPSIVLTSIVSDEPDNGQGDGNPVDDIQQAAIGTPDFTFKLRAERAGSGEGRVYTVTYTATDACGLSAAAAAQVVVPHN